MLYEYKVWYCSLLAVSYDQVQPLDWIFIRVVVLEGCFVCWRPTGHPVVEEKGEGFENGKIRGFEVQPSTLTSPPSLTRLKIL